MVMNPFVIEGPAVISFSGGRTSAYMLRRILDEGLRPDVHVLFANTGKERPETLDFVRDCQNAWGVPVHWVEFAGQTKDGVYREVDYASASRNGEPFDAVIKARGFLPNPVMRFCTSELKIRPMRNWMRAHSYEDDAWTNIVGIRADEPRRVARMRSKNDEGRWDVAMPLADAGITEADVMAFWAISAFDLRLRQMEGNCDLCFLKRLSKKVNIIRDRPDLAVWWVEKERDSGKLFRRDQPRYLDMLLQRDLFRDGQTDDSLIECYCTD